MTKHNLLTKVLSCLLVLCLLTSSLVGVSFTKEKPDAPTYILKTMTYPNEVPVKWRFTTASGYSETRTISSKYYRGASISNPNDFNYVAYCMDWGVRGPSTNGSTYDHVTKNISEQKMNQLTYVLMNGYSGSKDNYSYTLTNKYNVNRYGRPLTLTDDGGTGTMCMQLATQIAIWLVMGSDSRGRTMTVDGWVENNNCQNLDRDIVEMALDLYEGSFAVENGINWLSTDIASTNAGRYDEKTNSKLYGPLTITSDFTKSSSPVIFDLSQAPVGTKIYNDNMEEVKELNVYDEFYVSVPNSSTEQEFNIGLSRQLGTVLPLSYEEANESRQRMFFSSLSAVSTNLTIGHNQADAKIKITKTSDDNVIEGFKFMVYRYKTVSDLNPSYLGTFVTDKNGEIRLSGLNSGFYQIIEALDYEQSKTYIPTVLNSDGSVMENTADGIMGFEIPENGMMNEYQVHFHNKVHTTTKLVINKVDMYTAEPIVGATFRVYKAAWNPQTNKYVPAKDANGNYIYWDGVTTDASFGKLMFTKDGVTTPYLPIDIVYTDGKVLAENNTYVIGETVAPNGYVKLATPYTYSFTQDDVNKLVILRPEGTYDDYVGNRPYLNSLKVQKYEVGTTKPIADVQYNIYEERYGDKVLIGTMTTNANGVAYFGLDASGQIDITNGNALRFGNKYYLKEVSAPDGYEMTTGYIEVPEVKEDLTELSITLYNKTSDGSFTLNKVNDKNEKLANVEFTLFKIKDAYIEEFDDYMNSRNDIGSTYHAEYKYLTYFMADGTRVNIDEVADYMEIAGVYQTDANGQIHQTLPYGDYILLETKALDGYKTLNAVYRFGIYQSGFNYYIECTNDPISGSVKLIKTSSVTGEFIQGVQFELYKAGEALAEPDVKIGSYTTDEKGEIEINGLQYGDYFFIETYTPDRYEQPNPEDTKIDTKFTISKDGEVQIVSYANDEKPCNLIVYKTDKDTGRPLSGVKFALMLGDKLYKEAVTNKDGEAVFADLELGQYTLMEVTAAEGYDINAFQPVTVDVNTYSVHKVYIDNEKIKGDIKILKVDKDTNKPLENVEFTLYKADDETNALRTLKTDANGVVLFEDVEYGEYVIVETKTLNGYKKSETKTYVKVDSSKEYFYTITNEIIKRTINLIKIDKDTQIPIADVEFDVYALVDGEYVKYTTVKTDENGKCDFTLPFGEYELRETKTGKGYKLTDETTKIDLTLEDIEDILEITITNELIKNKVTLYKSGDTVGNYLSGAVYGLYDLNTDELLAEGTTDENGMYCFGEIAYGSYYLKEIKAPEGYTLSNDIIKFTVDENSPEEQIINAVDHPIPQTGVSSKFVVCATLMGIASLLSMAIVILEINARKLERAQLQHK